MKQVVLNIFTITKLVQAISARTQLISNGRLCQVASHYKSEQGDIA